MPVTCARWVARGFFCVAVAPAACASEPPSPPPSASAPTPPTAPAEPSAAPETGGSAPASDAASIRIGTRDLTVVTDREDVAVRGVTLSIFVSDPAQTWIDGVHPPSTHRYVALERRGDGSFHLPAIDVGVSPPAFACVSLKAWLEGLSNEIDGLYYAHVDDRYALTSYCTAVDPAAFAAAAPRFGQNRAARREDFEAVLGQRIVVRLNDRPLPAASAAQRAR